MGAQAKRSQVWLRLRTVEDARATATELVDWLNELRRADSPHEISAAAMPIMTMAAMHEAGVTCGCGRPQCLVEAVLEAARRFHTIAVAGIDGKAPPREVGLADVLDKIGGGG